MPEATSPAKKEVILRAAESKDVEAISALGARVFAASFAHSMPQSDLEAYLRSAYALSSISSDLANPDMNTIVACDALDHVVGFTQLTRGTTEDCLAGSEKPIELQRLYVAEDYHGSGVGKKLISCVETMAREMGFVTMWLGVWEENIKAQRVYERMGFRKVGEHDFKMGDCVQTDWVMSKKL